jgi:hypothetical protein
MTTNHHTALPFGGPLTSAGMEAPLGQLDAAIASVIATGSGTSTTLTAQANAGQASLTVASSTGFAPGDPIYIGTGATFESRIVNTVPGGGVTITVTVNLTNTYAIGKPVSKSPVEIVDARAGLTSLGARLATMEGAVNVKTFGAKGDGTTNDSPAFQAAHDSLPASGGTLFIPPGTYVSAVGTPLLTITKNGVRIIGAGRGNTILKLVNSHSATGAQVIKGTNGSSDLYIGHLTIDGNKANNGTGFSAVDTPCGISIIATNTVRVTIEDVRVYDVWGSGAVETFGINIGNTEGVILNNIYVDACGSTGIALSGCNDFVISNCVVVENGNQGFSISSNATNGSEGGTVSNCFARGNANGFNFESCYRMALSGLSAYMNGFYGFVFHVSGAIPTIFAHDISGAGLTAGSNGTALPGATAGILLSGNGTQGAYGIYLTGVRAYDDQATKTQAFGVVSLAGSINNSIEGDLSGNLLGSADLSLGVGNRFRTARSVFARIRHSAAQSLTSAVLAPLAFDTNVNDDDGYHFTSAAALTGTVAKTNGSAVLTGTGTTFLSQLSPGQVIDVPGTATERKVVKSIASNTSLTVWSNFANTASGQTATRVNSAAAIPRGYAGPHRISGGAQFASNATGFRELRLYVNSVLIRAVSQMALSGGEETMMGIETTWTFADGDYVELQAEQTSGGALNVNGGSASTPVLEIIRL